MKNTVEYFLRFLGSAPLPIIFWALPVFIFVVPNLLNVDSSPISFFSMWDPVLAESPDGQSWELTWAIVPQLFQSLSQAACTHLPMS